LERGGAWRAIRRAPDQGRLGEEKSRDYLGRV
jgi:hypothetical protein